MNRDRRRSRKGSVITVIAVISLWFGLIVSAVIIRFVGWLILTGAVGCICYILGSRNVARNDSIYSGQLRTPDNTVTGNVLPPGTEPRGNDRIRKLAISSLYGIDATPGGYEPGWHGTNVGPYGAVRHTDAVSRYPDIAACPHCGATASVRDGVIQPHHKPGAHWLSQHNPVWDGPVDPDRGYCPGDTERVDP
jgi:hypothetical protein